MGTIAHNSVVEHCLRLLNVQDYRHPYADHGAKKLLTGPMIALLVEAQLRQRETLWDIEENLRQTPQLQDLLGFESIHSSTVYRKLCGLPTEALKQLAVQLFQRIDRYQSQSGCTSRVGRLHLLDSTTIALPKSMGQWAYVSQDLNGVKIHLSLVMATPKVTYPQALLLSTAAVSDQTGALELVVDKDATYVMDRGYINYGHYYQWNQAQIQFVTRVKANSKFSVLEARDPTGQEKVLWDADVKVVDKEGHAFTLRLIEYLDDQERTYRVVTNRWDLTAAEIAQVYKARWMIELFFKWMKQHLKLVKLYNHKPRAVWNQIWLAMIAYGLLELIKMELQTTLSAWQILKRLRHSWMVSWKTFLASLNRPSTRTSRGRVKKQRSPREHPVHRKPVLLVEK